MADLYQDNWISCTDEAIVIRWYYPWGSKRIPYPAIRSARRVELRPLHGKGRIWGTANLRYWASLDPARARKEFALILDVGSPLSPLISPDDVPAVEEIIRERARLAEIPFAGVGPII